MAKITKKEAALFDAISSGEFTNFVLVNYEGNLVICAEDEDENLKALYVRLTPKDAEAIEEDLNAGPEDDEDEDDDDGSGEDNGDEGDDDESDERDQRRQPAGKRGKRFAF